MTHPPKALCPYCHAPNKIPPEVLSGAWPADKAVCASCGQKLFYGKPARLKAADFNRHLAGDLPVLADFWAGWCGPCKAMDPVLEKAAKELEPHVRVVKIDTDREQKLAGAHSIRGLPTLVLFRHGREVGRRAGAQPLGDLLAWVRGAL